MTSTIRSSWGVVLLMLVALFSLAPAALAGTVRAQLNDPPSSNVLDGIYVGPYNGTNLQTGGSMQVICDDFKDESNYSPATYTTNSFSSLGSTLWGSSLLSQHYTMGQVTALYEQAGWLAFGVMSTTGTQQGYYSYALWAVFDPSDVLTWLYNAHDWAACNAIFGDSSCTSSHPAAGSLLYDAEQDYMSRDYSDLLILTPGGCGQAGCSQEQEFFEFVPEGGSPLLYLLLAGLSCFVAIWRSRRHNLASQLQSTTS